MPSYANVVSTLALVLALGGAGAGAYAATSLAPKSVGERQLRPGAVTADKLRRSAVTAPKIKSSAIKQGKLASGAVTAPKLASAAVEARALATASVSGEKIAADAVTGDKVVESTLSQVPAARSADQASFADSANPVAFAAVDGEGNVNPSHSKGISPADVVRKAAGVYCISVSSFNPRGAQVTLRNTGDGQFTSYVTIGGTEPCPAPLVEVRTYKGVLTSAPFYITLYR